MNISAYFTFNPIYRAKSHLMVMLWLLVAFITVSPLSYAQTHTQQNNAKVVATVSKNKVTDGEVFQLRIVYLGAAHREDFDPSPLSKDFFTGQVQFGSSRYSVNGEVTLRSEWNISLAAYPLKDQLDGTVTIPSFTIDGQQTQPISLVIQHDDTMPDGDELMSFSATISKQQLYPNESATLHTRLYIKTNPRAIQHSQLTEPQGNGLDIKAVGEPNQYQKVINDVENTILEQDYQVTALQAGKVTLHPPRLTASVIDSSRRIVPVDVQAEPITLTVLAKPNDYQEAWLPTQSLQLKQGWLDNQGQGLTINDGKIEINVGEPITRQITLVVQDISAEHLPKLHISYPDSVRVYDEKPKFGQDKQGNTVMTMQQVIMAKHSGSISLPEINVPWWDSQQQKAQLASVNGLQLNVTQDANAIMPMTNNTPTNSPSSVVPTTVDNPTTQIDSPQHKLWFYVSIGLAGLWLATLALWYRDKKKPLQINHSDNPLPSNSTAPLTGLLTAIDNKDGVAIQTYYRQWLHLQLDSGSSQSDLQPIEQQIQALLASLYGSNQATFDCHSLKKQLKNSLPSKESTRKTLPLAQL